MTTDHLIAAIDTYRLGDIASITGLVVGVVGFGITIYNVSRSKTASKQAAESVVRVREDLKRMETVSDFSSVLTSLEDVKRLHRDGAWALLPERYSSLRRTLIAIRSSDASLSDEERKAIQSAIAQLGTLERMIDEHLASDEASIDVPKINSIVSMQIDRLHEVLIRLRGEIGEIK